jgi:FtsZ-binding cell division protein ZapB
MKNLKYTIGLLLLILLNGNLFGQIIDLNESEVYFEGEKTMALVITLPLDDGDLRNEWADYLDENFEIDLDMVKRKRDTTVFISEEVINNNLSDTSYAIYSKIVDKSNGNSTLYTFWATNKNGLLEKRKHNDKVKKSKIIMLDFAQKVYVEFYKEQIITLKTEQQKLMKKHDKLERRNEQLTKRNNRYREKTKNREKRINLNEEQKERNRLEIRQLMLLYKKLEGKINVLNYEVKIISA